MKTTRARLFITCWLIFVLHFATDFAREHYLILSMVEDFSFKLDKYVGLHNDIFVTSDHGAHHGANPGASMIAAVPYLVFRPVINETVEIASKMRKPTQEATAVYQDDRPARVQFYKQVYERGLDIKFGLVGFVTMAFCMAPLSAISSVVMFNALNYLGLSIALSLWLSFLYSFGTPVLFRTAYLNQNMMVGIFGFLAFILLWQQDRPHWLGPWHRLAIAGFLGGMALLCDYSGLVVLFIIGIYGLLRRLDTVSWGQSIKDSMWYVAGAMGPIFLLWFYQWRSFGHPFYPGQHYMPETQVMHAGYQGFSLPSMELLWMLLFDPSFGLFIAAPILALSFLAPVLSVYKRNIVPLRETLFILSFFIAFLLFCSSIQYTRFQWITGIRYIVPVIPFLFLLTVAVLVRMPRIVAYGLAILAFWQSWSMAMVRLVDVPGKGIIDSVILVFLEGFQLPWLNTLAKASSQYVPFLEGRPISPFPFLLIWGLIIYGVWRISFPWKSVGSETHKVDR